MSVLPIMLVSVVATADERVDESGGFRTSVEFELPAYHGLEPDLGLDYNSHSGPGDAGVGWQLTGVSTITRSDDRRGAPSYDAADAFWLDGVQLLPCTSAPSGAACFAGGTHTTRIENYARIIFDSSTNTWRVTTRDGVESTYTAQLTGAGSSGNTGTYRWAISQRKDSHDNTVSYSYDCESLAYPYLGECVLVRVSYGQSKQCTGIDLPPKSPSGEARLYWESRGDTQSLGAGDTLIESHRRLKTVAVTRAGLGIRAYALHYQRSTSGGASILTAIDQYGTDAVIDAIGNVTSGSKLPTTSYKTASLGAPLTDWSVVQESATTAVGVVGAQVPNVATQKPPLSAYPYDRFVSADINGDGRSDFVKISADHALQTMIAKADGTYDIVKEVPFATGGWSTPFTVIDLPTNTYWYAGDVNGDGRQDIMNVMRHEPICDSSVDAPCNCTINEAHIALRVAISKGDGHYTYQEQHLAMPFRLGFSLTWSVQWSISVSFGPIPVGASGTIWHGSSIWIDEAWMVGDADGDGRTDFMRAQRYARQLPAGGTSNSVRLQVFRSNGSSFSTPSTNNWEIDTDWTWDDNSIAKDRFFAGDVDGDRRTDFMIVSAHRQNLPGHTTAPHSSLHTALSRGDGTFDLREDDEGLTWDDHDIWFPGDHNGDGRTDFFRVQWHGKNYHAGVNDHGALQALVSRGNGEFDVATLTTETPWPWHQPPPCVGTPIEAPWIPGDFDNDGRTDVAHIYTQHDYNCVANYGRSITVGKILNRPGGAVLEITPIPTVDWYSEHPTLVATGDANGDGSDDIMFAHAPFEEMRCDNTCSVWRYYDLHTLFSKRTTNNARSWQPTDINGDGREDLVYVQYTNPGYRVHTLLRQSSGALTPLGDTIAPPPNETLDNAGAQRFTAGDVGGAGNAPDGKGDLVLVDHDGTTLKVVTLLSDGDGTWTTVIDRPITGPFSPDLVNWRRADVNGDGLLDLVNMRKPASPGVIVTALLSKGDGKWQVVESMVAITQHGSDTRLYRPADVDGDGRDDLVYIGPTYTATLLAQSDGTFVGVFDAFTGGSVDGANWQPAEINGDGRLDFVHVRHDRGTNTLVFTYLLSRGGGKFARVVAPGLSFPGGGFYGQTSALQFADLDGDGKSDFTLVTRWKIQSYTHVYWAMNQWPAFAPAHDSATVTQDDTTGWRVMDLDSDGRSDLTYTEGGISGLRLPLASDRLISVDNGIGGQRTISYGKSSGTHVLMPIGVVLHPVATLSTDDVLRGAGADDTRGYLFDRATWSYADRRLVGYAKVSSTDPRGTINTTFSLDECGPRPALVERLGGSGAIERSRYTYLGIGTAAPLRCLPNVQEHDDCEGTTKCRVSRTRYRYDGYGNVVELTEYGDVADTTDDRLVETPVRPNFPLWIVDRPAYRAVYQTDGAGGWNRRTFERFVYDGQVDWLQPAIDGDVTRLETWNDQAGAWISTEMSYTQSGLLREVTSPPVNSTSVTRTIDYDCVFEELPEQVCVGPVCSQAIWDIRRGRLEHSIAPNGGQTDFTIDVHGRAESSTTPDGTTLTFEHAMSGPSQVVRQKLEDKTLGQTIDIETVFDGLGRTWSVNDGTVVRDYNYDGASVRLQQESLPHAPGVAAQWVSYTYDAADRPTSMIHPDGARQRFTYGVGTASSMNELGNWRTAFYDPWGNIVAVREELGYCLDGTCEPTYQWTHYKWDALEQLVEIVDDHGNVSTASYDSLKRKVESCDPDRGCTSYTWRDDGQLATETDANGEGLRLGYDATGRVMTKEYLDNSMNVTRTVAYTWDLDPVTQAPRGGSRGAMVRIEDSETGTDDFWYDLMGRPEREKRCIDSTCMSWAVAYDSIGRVASLTYPDAQGDVSLASEVVRYEYDGTGRLVRVPGYIEQIGYGPAGHAELVRYANGVENRTTLDPKRMWLNHEEVRAKSGQPLYSASYQRDAAGRIYEMTMANPAPVTSTFGYDPLDRLTSVGSTDPRMVRTFEYDSIGNLTYHSKLGHLYYNDANHVHAVTDTDSGNNYTYDNKGNLVRSHALGLRWNADGMPTEIKDRSTGTSTTYAYDPTGQLARRDGATGTTLIFGDLVELEPGGQPVYYYYAMDQRIAQRRGGDVTYYHTDHLDSTRLITDGNGNVVNRYDLGPFGEMLGQSTQVPNVIGFAQGRPEEHGLIYMNARWMDPEIGRFISADSIIPEPFDPQSLNRYSYVRNNPISRIDPSGHQDKEAEESVSRVHYEKMVCREPPPTIETSLKATGPAARKPASRAAKTAPPAAPPPQTIGANEPSAAPPVKQPDPVAKPSVMTFEQWKTKTEGERELSMTPEAREAAAITRKDDYIAETYVLPVFHKISMGTRILSSFATPNLSPFIDIGIDYADQNMRDAGYSDWDSTPPVPQGAAMAVAARGGKPGVAGVIIKLVLSKAKVGPYKGLVRAKYAGANDLISRGVVQPKVRAKLPYDYRHSQRYVRDLTRPGKAIGKTKIPKGWNVDEKISRMHGGPSDLELNQHMLPDELNSYLGAMEMHATKGLPKGTPIRGFRYRIKRRAPLRRRSKWRVRTVSRGGAS